MWLLHGRVNTADLTPRPGQGNRPEHPKILPQTSSQNGHNWLNVNMNILICSQDPVLGQAVADVLVEVGFDVAFAHGRYETLSQPDLEAVELVVLDLDYRGKDAWDLVESLLEIHPLTPIVLLTSARAGPTWELLTAVGEMLERPLPPPGLWLPSAGCSPKGRPND